MKLDRKSEHDKIGGIAEHIIYRTLTVKEYELYL